MGAAYDCYDYPSFWVGREYEHQAEIVALKQLLQKIKKINKILEIGVGYGRLTPTYIYRARKIVLVDPSAKLLRIARKNFASKNVRFIQSRLDTLPGKLKGKRSDLAILVRVFHHIEDADKAFSTINHLLKKNGYFILEFPNKLHFKANLREAIKGNITFPLDIFPKDIRKKKPKKKTLPFLNYHPEIIAKKLKDNGFKILEERSVSNIRSPLLKKVIPLNTLLFLEKLLQKPLAKLSFGPSIFILAKKKYDL